MFLLMKLFDFFAEVSQKQVTYFFVSCNMSHFPRNSVLEDFQTRTALFKQHLPAHAACISLSNIMSRQQFLKKPANKLLLTANQLLQCYSDNLFFAVTSYVKHRLTFVQKVKGCRMWTTKQ